MCYPQHWKKVTSSHKAKQMIDNEKVQVFKSVWEQKDQTLMFLLFTKSKAMKMTNLNANNFSQYLSMMNVRSQSPRPQK